MPRFELLAKNQRVISRAPIRVSQKLMRGATETAPRFLRMPCSDRAFPVFVSPPAPRDGAFVKSQKSVELSLPSLPSSTGVDPSEEGPPTARSFEPSGLAELLWLGTLRLSAHVSQTSARYRAWPADSLEGESLALFISVNGPIRERRRRLRVPVSTDRRTLSPCGQGLNAYRDDRIYRWLLHHSSALPDVGGQPAPDRR